MRLSTRLAKAEGGLNDALLWIGAERLAMELGLPAKEMYAEARDISDRYWHLARPLPSGRVDIEPVLRAIAEAEDLDYDEFLAEVKCDLRRQRARERRKRQ